MQKVKKRIFLTTLAITTTLFIAGCSKVEGNPEKKDTNLIVEMPTENEKNKEIEDDIMNKQQPVNIKEQMTQGLSTLEIIKIKTAFPLMLDEMDRGQEYRFEQIITDLESMKSIVTFNPFKEDIEALQGLVQYNIDTGSLESLEYAMKMLNDLTLFGVDDPYDKKSPKAIEGWPIIFKEEKLFNVTKSLGNQYPPEIDEIIKKTNVIVDVSGNLRTDLIKKEEKIALELSKIKLENTQPLKEKSLQASELICDIRMSLIETDDKVEQLKRLVYTDKETLVKLINDCMGLLPEGNLKVEYSRILGYLEYINEEIQKENFDYDLIVKCLDGSQESLDDISVVILGDVNPKVNKRYSAALEMLEGNPVLYDWIKHELTGEYPEGGTPAKNYFGKALYVDENDIELTSSEKLQMILDVQRNANSDKEKTIDLYGFKIPCYVINIYEGELVDYKDTPYPYMWLYVEENRLMLSIVLSGCMSESKEPINTQTEQITSVSNEVNAEELVNNSSKVKIELSLINNTIENLPLLVMGPRQFDFEETRNMFFGDTVTSKELWENELGSAVSYVKNTGDELDVYTDCIRYTTELGNHMRSVFSPKTASITSTKSQELFDLINAVTDEELTFASQDDVIEEGLKFCNKLGITVSTSRPVVFALEYHKINKIQDQLIKENAFLKDFKEKSLDNNDSCYYMVFEVEENGICIDPSGNTSQSTGNLMSGSSIIMIVSTRGIEYFEVSGIIYEKKEPVIENKTLVPMQICLDKYTNKFDNDVLVKNVLVDNIKLYYVPIPKKDSKNVIFQPSWIFYSTIDVIIDEQSGSTHTMRDVTRIDATTGKEMM